VSTGASVRLGRRFNWPDNFFRGDWIYRIDKTELSDFNQYIIAANPNNIVNEQWPLISSSITQIFSRDSRNNPEFPTRGSSHSISTELSGGILGGDQDFFKVNLSAEWFIPLPFGLVLYSQNKYGILKKLTDETNILYGEYYYLGGSGLGFSEGLRGYDDGQIGPLTAGGSPKGGKSMFKTSLELRFPIAPNPTIFGLFFADAGNVWEEIGQTNPFDLYRSVGVGVRLFMPMIGIIGIDFGYGFDYYNENLQRSGKWKVHFQFGRF